MKRKIETEIEKLPKKPGIYFFKDKKNEVIYIGKARSLRERVRFYFHPTPDAKIKKILSEMKDIDFILTGSEKEASFLENNFVRQYQPKYNLRLKDDKTFPYLKLTLQENYPGIYFTRRVEEDGAKYFGPFSPAQQARKSIHLISKYFGIRTCREAVPGKRKRPCLEYDLKLCSAPCVGHTSESEYRESAENALLFLEGKTERLLKILQAKMSETAAQQEFEQAAHWRDLIHTIEQIKEKPKLISPGRENKDIIGFARENDNVALYVFYMRKGKVIESEENFLQQKEEISNPRILSSFLKKHYIRSEKIPEKILLPFAPVQKNALSKKLMYEKEKKIEIMIPFRGKNKQLVDLANSNAEKLLRKKSEELKPLEEIKNILSLKHLPKRIEGFDISNTGGKESVGSLVVFENGQPLKKEYRKYKIKTVEGPNDIASLQEIIQRRYAKRTQQKESLPDLILVDGGKGQVNAAKKILHKIGSSHIPIVSLAKKEEILFTPSQKKGIMLERTSPALKLCQNIRDEAHRFALSFHRLRRKRKSFESHLDGIPGLGKKRKAALLEKYKNIEEIRSVSSEELAQVIGSQLAQKLLNKLKSDRRSI